MAKINSVITDYMGTSRSISIPENAQDRVTEEIKWEVRGLFDGVRDTRVDGRVKYPIREILLVAFISSLCGYEDFEEMEAFGKIKLRFFRRFYPYKNGICSHDTFKRAISMINTWTLESATVDILVEIMGRIQKECSAAADKTEEKEEEYHQICMDGKENRGTGRCHGTQKEKRNFQTLNIYDRSTGICLHSSPISEKTNEIPTGQKLLQTMDLKNCIVTFDALHTQKKTCAIIRSQGGHYVGGLKGNQSGLLEEARLLFTEEAVEKCRKCKKDHLQTFDKAHSQSETRDYYRLDAWHEPSSEDDVWKDLKSFILVRKKITSLITGETHTEERYYISDLKDVEVLADAIRGHWQVETCLHFNLDYSMRQDAGTTTDRKADLHMGMIKKMALSILKLAKPLFGNKSLRLTGKMIGMDVENKVPMIFSSFTEENIRQAVQQATAKKKRK